MREVIACSLPTATARASTPVRATNSAASAGSVRTPGACAPSFPPTSPSSASIARPLAWHQAAISAVARRFSAHGSVDPSYITEPKPQSAASWISRGSVAWSRCSAARAPLRSAARRVAAASGASAPW